MPASLLPLLCHPIDATSLLSARTSDRMPSTRVEIVPPSCLLPRLCLETPAPSVDRTVTRSLCLPLWRAIDETCVETVATSVQTGKTSVLTRETSVRTGETGTEISPTAIEFVPPSCV
jgi:hypothetical protein